MYYRFYKYLRAESFQIKKEIYEHQSQTFLQQIPIHQAQIPTIFPNLYHPVPGGLYDCLFLVLPDRKDADMAGGRLDAAL